MGRRERRAEIRPVLWLSRRLVVDHSLDDIHGRKLSGMATIALALRGRKGTFFVSSDTEGFRERRITSCQQLAVWEI